MGYSMALSLLNCLRSPRFTSSRQIPSLTEASIRWRYFSSYACDRVKEREAAP